MSEQTDQLMLFHHGDEDFTAEQIKYLKENIKEAEGKLRWMTELNAVPSFHEFIKYMKSEAAVAFTNMERTTSDVDTHKSVGAYTALQRACEFVPEQLQTLGDFITKAKEELRVATSRK